MARPNRWVGLEPEGMVSSGPHPWVRRVFLHGGFLIRHGIAAACVVVLSCVLWTVVYVGCLVFAALMGVGPGSPAAYPLGLLVVFVASLLLVATTLFPATALAEVISRKKGWSTFIQIPLSVGLCLLLALLLSSVSWAVRDQTFDVEIQATEASLCFLLCLIPLGIYWWIVQSGPLLLKALRWLWQVVSRPPREQ